jgi:hypothetical protein
MSRGLAEVEQAILTFMRSDAFLGSKWTPRELHFFLYGALYGKYEDADHAWKSRALEASIRRGLASLQHKGLVKKHTVSRQGWLGSPSEIKWSLGEAEMNNAESKPANRCVINQQVCARMPTALRLGIVHPPGCLCTGRPEPPQVLGLY